MARLQLTFFGAPRIALDGTPVSIPERKPIALLAYLAVTGELHTRDHVATLFWPELSQPRARANLRYARWMLKKFLGDEWFTGDREAIGFSASRLDENGARYPAEDRTAGHIAVDVLRFQALVNRTRNRTATSLAPVDVRHLQEAAALAGADFLAGFTLADSPAFDDWQFFQREALQRQLANVLEQLVDYHRKYDALTPAIDCARRRLALDPLHEAAHRQLMRLYAESGQWAAALRQYDQCVDLLEETLGTSPEAVTTELYSAIRARQIPLLPLKPTRSAETRPRHNLPVQPTPFVGRTKELARIAELLSEESCGLLTLIGPGGMGKTRLAIEAATAQIHAYEDGIWFVSLNTVEAPERLPSAILDALAVPRLGATAARTLLLNYLRDKQLLLVLDNFEHLVDWAELLVEIGGHAPGAKCLVTSRERLNLREEWLFPVAGMENDAVQLFLQCARRLGTDFATATELAQVTKVCELVEGMPLAIELAAAWLPVLSLQEIAAEIGQRLEFLTTSLRNVPARHRSLHAVFDHSWDMLSTDERCMLCEFAVFRGGCTRAAAQTVTGASLANLAALANKSWLRTTMHKRYDIHPLILQYLLEKLADEYAQLSGERVEHVRDRHAVTYLTFLQRHEDDLFGPRRQAALEEILPEMDNVRAAWRWAVERARVDWLATLECLWILVHAWGLYHEGVQIYANAAEKLKAKLASLEDEDSPRQAQKIQECLATLLCWQGWLCTDLGLLAHAESLCAEGLALLEDTHASARSGKAYAHALLSYGWALYHQGEYVQAAPRFREALTRFDALQEPWLRALTNMFIGLNYFRQGAAAQAQGFIQAALDYWDECDDSAQRSACLRILSQIASAQGDYPQAQMLMTAALKAGEESGVLKQVCHSRLSLGELALAQGYYAEAQHNYELGLKIVRTSGDRLGEVAFCNGLGAIALAGGDYALAVARFQDNVAVCLEIGRRRDAVIAWIGLGNVATAQKEYEKAAQYFAQALAVATEMQARPEALRVVVSKAELYAEMGETDEAISMLESVLRDPGAAHETKTQARNLLAALR